MARGNTERIELLRDAALALNNTTRFGKDFPLGQGWERLILELTLDLTIGTGTGAIAEGELSILKGLHLKTDRGESPINNVPGRQLYRWDQFKSFTAAPKDAIAAATAKYRVFFIHHFVDPIVIRPYDTILDTSRYKKLELLVTLGGLADLLTTVGTAALTATLTAVVERTKDPLEGDPLAPVGDPAIGTRPKFAAELGAFEPVNATAETKVDVERATNASYKRFGVFAGSGGVAGVAFSGAASDAIIDDLDVDVPGDKPYEKIVGRILRGLNKQDHALEASLVGWHLIDFLTDRSNLSAVFSGDKSRFAVRWRNLGGLPGNPFVTVGYEALRPLE